MSEHWSGQDSRRARAYWRPKVLTGTVECWRCHRLIDPREGWDVGHLVDLAAGGSKGLSNQAPEHIGCNRRAGQAAANQVRKAVAKTRKGLRSW